MRKILLLALFLCPFVLLKAQQPAGTFSYYIEIKGAVAKQQTQQLSGIVKAKPGITLFHHYRTARPFFVLMSQNAVSRQQFSGWLSALGMELTVFEQKTITAAFLTARRLERKAGQKADRPAASRN